MSTNINGKKLRVNVDETTFALLPKSSPTPLINEELTNKGYVDSEIDAVNDYSSHLTYSPPIPAPLGGGYTTAAMISLNTASYVANTFAIIASVGSKFNFGTSNLVLSQIRNQFSWNQTTGYLTCLIPGNYLMSLHGLAIITNPPPIHFIGPAINDNTSLLQRLSCDENSRYWNHRYFLTLALNDRISFVYNQNQNTLFRIAYFSVCLTKRN